MVIVAPLVGWRLRALVVRLVATGQVDLVPLFVVRLLEVGASMSGVARGRDAWRGAVYSGRLLKRVAHP